MSKSDGPGGEAAFREAVGRGGQPAYLLVSPHNPTGTVHTAAELADVAQPARRYGVRVVADEIHAPIVAPGARFVPYLSVPGAENGLSVMSASKAWNLAGLKAAIAIAGAGAGDDPAAAFLERGRVALNPGVSFGPGGAGFVRMDLATSSEILTEAVHRMADSL